MEVIIGLWESVGQQDIESKEMSILASLLNMILKCNGKYVLVYTNPLVKATLKNYGHSGGRKFLFFFPFFFFLFYINLVRKKLKILQKKKK